MGTSKSYSASLTGQPQWGKLSRIVTTTCGSGTAPTSNLGKIVGRYVNVIGGASRAGSGHSKIGGRASLRTALKLGGFINSFKTSGGNLELALQQTGLTDLSTKSVSDIINHLIEYCSGPASTIDDSAAKEASSILLEELIANAQSLEEMQERLQANLNKYSLEEIMIKYFSNYIHEHLSRMFYEKLIKEKGKTSCNNLFRNIKEFIIVRMGQMNKNNPLNNIDWGGGQGARIIARIQQDVLTVFENYED